MENGKNMRLETHLTRLEPVFVVAATAIAVIELW